eukprot:ctg_1688.g450
MLSLSVCRWSESGGEITFNTFHFRCTTCRSEILCEARPIPEQERVRDEAESHVEHDQKPDVAAYPERVDGVDLQRVIGSRWQVVELVGHHRRERIINERDVPQPRQPHRDDVRPDEEAAEQQRGHDQYRGERGRRLRTLRARAGHQRQRLGGVRGEHHDHHKQEERARIGIQTDHPVGDHREEQRKHHQPREFGGRLAEKVGTDAIRLGGALAQHNTAFQREQEDHAKHRPERLVDQQEEQHASYCVGVAAVASGVQPDQAEQHREDERLRQAGYIGEALARHQLEGAGE